jgi:hypothetical protein
MIFKPDRISLLGSFYMARMASDASRWYLDISGQILIPTQDYKAYLHLRSLQWSARFAASKRFRLAYDMPFVRMGR